MLWAMRTNNPNGTSIASAVFAQMTAECPYTGLPVSPSKLFLFMLASGPHVIRGSLGSPESGTQMATWSFQPSLQGSLLWQTDRATDRPTDHANFGGAATRMYLRRHIWSARRNSQRCGETSFRVTSLIHVLCANFVKFGRPEVGEIGRCLPDKKNKISARSFAVASAPIAPKICQGQRQRMYSECPKFHPNRFTSGGVIAERVNTVQTRHKVFPILGEGTASSSSNYQIDSLSRGFRPPEVVGTCQLAHLCPVIS